ncbi:MAG: hypothetical protein HXN76_06040 [Prevotella pallens]|jgi:hypothetical protein|uniref:hypothetical protein n=1 Tax=Prevotella pallens TaxID=60133 RepID=UPI001CAB88CF|nr:hypothetical protein [Prevotella pallens]MBF1453177.1 hypothetical protein [Prevotella nigrescens]MBF1442170.1 hypothetical protein [Prevotella pallens]MBF1453814.1 hypothetical protein [Prevotella nigrescens]MBF1459134.1 hypothetical protein [Prevotella pallens]MBF1481411.1 hypothetical protein [Prevotella pallens]
MKIKLNWKMFIVFFGIIGGLYIITKSILITSGIMVILLLIDGFLREYELKKQGKKQAEEILKEIERDTKEEEENKEEGTN